MGGDTEFEEAYRLMDLKALRCFWALGKRGSLIGAGISEPAVSKRVRTLESYLGTKLYESLSPHLPEERAKISTSGVTRHKPFC